MLRNCNALPLSVAAVGRISLLSATVKQMIVRFYAKFNSSAPIREYDLLHGYHKALADFFESSSDTMLAMKITILLYAYNCVTQLFSLIQT